MVVVAAALVAVATKAPAGKAPAAPKPNRSVPATTPASPLALVVNHGAPDGTGASVSVIDSATHTVVGTVLQNLELDDVAIAPDAQTGYVTVVNYGPNHEDVLIPVILRGGQAQPQPPVDLDPGCRSPSFVVVVPSGAQALVSCLQGVMEVNLLTTPPTPGPVVDAPTLSDIEDLVVAPNGATAYAVFSAPSATSPSGLPNARQFASLPPGETAPGSGVQPIDLTTNPPTPGNPVAVGSSATQMAVSPDGATGYVSDIAESAVYPLNLTTTPITVGPPVTANLTHPYGVALTPNGHQLYAVNNPGNSVTPIDVAAHPPQPGTPIPVGSAPLNVAALPNGRQMLVTNQSSETPPQDGSVSVIDTSTKAVVATVPAGALTNRLAVQPDQAPVAKLAVTPAPAGQPTSFDASASTVAFGTITSYLWNFGDGNAEVTSKPTTTHVYGSAGTYGAAVLETDSAGTSTAQVFTGRAMLRNGGPSALAQQTVNVGTPPAPYHPLQPYRVLDTRVGQGAPRAPIGPGQSLSVRVAGTTGPDGQGVPSNALAVVVNVTATNPTAASFFSVFPTGQSPPLASSLNFAAGQTVPNLVEVGIGTDGQVTIFNHAGSTDAVADVEGYVLPATDTSGRLNAQPPARITDTRPGSGQPNAGKTLGANGNPETLSVQVTGAGGVPASGVEAAVLNVTVTNPSAPSYLTVWPAGQPQPATSNLNFLAGQTVPNRVVVPVGAGGQVNVANFNGTADVIVDVNGWFTDSTVGSGTLFSAISPTRILDTRTSHQTLGPGATLPVKVAGANQIPSGAQAVAVNTTVTNGTASSFLTVFPEGSTPPLASDLNWVPGQTVANLVVPQLGTGSGAGGVNLFNHAGMVDVVMDVDGWYEPAG